MSHRTVPLKLVDRHEIGTAVIVVHAPGASPTSAGPALGAAAKRNRGDLRRATAGSDVDPEALGAAERKQGAG